MVDGVPFDIMQGLFLLKNNWFDYSPVDPLVLIKEGKYTLKLTGKMPAPMSEEGVEIVKGEQMDMRCTLEGGDLSIINFLKWIDTAEGLTDADLRIRGTKEFPSISGKIKTFATKAGVGIHTHSLRDFFCYIII